MLLSAIGTRQPLPLIQLGCLVAHLDLFAEHFLFGGKQIHASEDDGSINHALVRDLRDDAERLEKFGAELEAEMS
ncbi:RNA binding (RRM/RBD/RNP motifs) family protein [Actinidia rufa]|uniref:RNA binding (RRM/RBD/RNP motifs) family protein n=1 Tax=Actinidia rufa TaxID=165716 RepID=A0A7J0GKC9_9ERIC|nr:RNA binding (RRM/RBD/RNP motifs) family protein [Actinidia rufa]